MADQQSFERSLDKHQDKICNDAAKLALSTYIMTGKPYIPAPSNAAELLKQLKSICSISVYIVNRLGLMVTGYKDVTVAPHQLRRYLLSAIGEMYNPQASDTILAALANVDVVNVPNCIPDAEHTDFKALQHLARWFAIEYCKAIISTTRAMALSLLQSMIAEVETAECIQAVFDAAIQGPGDKDFISAIAKDLNMYLTVFEAVITIRAGDHHEALTHYCNKLVSHIGYVMDSRVNGISNVKSLFTDEQQLSVLQARMSQYYRHRPRVLRGQSDEFAQLDTSLDIPLLGIEQEYLVELNLSPFRCRTHPLVTILEKSVSNPHYQAWLTAGGLLIQANNVIEADPNVKIVANVKGELETRQFRAQGRGSGRGKPADHIGRGGGRQQRVKDNKGTNNDDNGRGRGRGRGKGRGRGRGRGGRGHNWNNHRGSNSYNNRDWDDRDDDRRDNNDSRDRRDRDRPQDRRDDRQQDRRDDKRSIHDRLEPRDAPVKDSKSRDTSSDQGNSNRSYFTGMHNEAGGAQLNGVAPGALSAAADATAKYKADDDKSWEAIMPQSSPAAVEASEPTQQPVQCVLHGDFGYLHPERIENLRTASNEQPQQPQQPEPAEVGQLPLINFDELQTGVVVASIDSAETESYYEIQARTLTYEVNVVASGKIREQNVIAMVDTGNQSPVPLINTSVAEILKLKVYPSTKVKLSSVDGTQLRQRGMVQIQLTFDSNYSKVFEMAVVDDLHYAIVLNADFASSCNIMGPSRTLELPDGSSVPLSPSSLTWDNRPQLKLSANVMLQPKAATLVAAVLVGDFYDTLTIDTEAVGLRMGTVSTAGTVIVQGNKAYVTIVNPNDEPVELTRDTTVAVVMTVRHSINELAQDAMAKPDREDDNSASNKMVDFPLKHSNGVEFTVKVAERYVEQLGPILAEFADVFAVEGDDLGLVHGYELSIPTDPTCRPTVTRERPMNPAQRKVADETIEDMLKRGIIEKSMSPWNAALLLAKQPSQASGFRFCVDYRALNAVTLPQNTALPHGGMLVRELAGYDIYSTVDVKSAYHCLPVKKSDQEKTAFSHRGTTYSWLRAPFGLRGIPAVFQMVMSKILGNIAKVFLDDCARGDDDIETHCKNVRVLLSRLHNAGIKLNAKKCQFGSSMVKYLGHVCDKRGISLDTGRYVDFFDKPAPTNKKELTSALAFYSVYRRYINNYAEIISPLKSLQSDDRKKSFKFDDKQMAIWDHLKTVLLKESSLAQPDYNKPFAIAVDASNVAWGAALFQLPERRPIAFASGQFNKAQKNYTATERELAGMINALDHFDSYLDPNIKLTVYTDHKALQYLTTFHNKNSRLIRWSMALQEYDLHIVHVPGAKHGDADYLSRAPFRSRFDFVAKMRPELPLESSKFVIAPDQQEVVANIQAPEWWRNRTFWQELDGNETFPVAVISYERRTELERGLRYLNDLADDKVTHRSVSAVTRSTTPRQAPASKSSKLDVLPPLVKLGAFSNLVPKRVHQREAQRASKLAEIASQAELIDIANIGSARKSIDNIKQVKPASRAYLQQEIARLQQYDPHLLNAKEFIKLKEGPFVAKYNVTDAYLALLRRYCPKERVERHRRDMSPDFKATSHRDKLLVRIFVGKHERRVVALPLCLRDYVLELYHDSFEAGHMGINNTFSRIAARYHWPGMRQDIANYVRSCKQCLARKGSVAKVELPLNKILASHFNEMLCVDMTHPGQQHGRGQPSGSRTRSTKAILTITDVWSHMTVLVTVAAESAAAYVTAFHNHWFKFFGTPRYILSDNGACFVSDYTAKYYQDRGILPITITARNPQANGIAERVNRPITDAISMLIGTGDDWEHLMPYLQLMLNSRCHPVLGMSPLEAVMGHVTLFAEDHESADPQTHSEHLQRMKAIRKGIDQVYSGMQRTLKPRLLKYIKIKRYSPDDLVRIFIKRSDTHKRAPRWSEPMTVIKCVSSDDRHPVNYLLKDKAGKELTSHINQMKQHFERDPNNKGALKQQRKSRKQRRKANSKAKSNDSKSALATTMQTAPDTTE